MNRLAAAALVAIAMSMSAVGCHSMTPPPGFARLDANDDYAWRATSAEGVVLGIRREKNDPKGNLEFWASAVRYELERKGYQKVDIDQVRSIDGVDGRRLRYRTTRDGRPYVMWATVYVTDSRVVVVEAGGDEAHFASVKNAVDQAIRSVEAG
jgi:hypothetical protein